MRADLAIAREEIKRLRAEQERLRQRLRLQLGAEIGGPDRAELIARVAGLQAVNRRLVAERDARSAEADAAQRRARELEDELTGYCTRPPELDCQFESICESCTFFATTFEFRPTLERQRDAAAAKGQSGRQQFFNGLLARLDGEAS